uniref:thiol:disulfide interchange protein DsbA/DsbL n=1 Tax=Roseateles sp. TaxID=1971397 RepID=UPI00286BF704
MMMKRRDFSAIFSLSATGLLAVGLPTSALAQGGPVEGKQFQRLGQPLAVAPGKIEVVEFFWYGCPHCNTFEPQLEAWAKKLPSDVVLKRVPVAFRDDFVPHQRLFYTLEAMGKLDDLHRKVFQTIHVDKQSVDKEASILAW